VSRERWQQLGWFAVKVTIFTAMVVLLSGCASWPWHSTPPTPDPKHPFQSMTQALAEIDSLMGIIYALSIACVGLGIVLMFYLKTSLGPALIAGGIGTLILSLFIKTLLWFIPWIAGGVVLLGAIAFAIDVHKRGFWNAVKDVQQHLGSIAASPPQKAS
jgi:hypothetical protein